MTFADARLACRLEAAEAAIARACTSRPAGTAVLEVAGGCAIFAGGDSPLTHAVGIGLAGPVPACEIDRMEAFFRSRGARVSIDLCPLADPGLLHSLAERGYRPTEFNNVLVRRLSGSEAAPAPRVRRAASGEGELWSHTVGAGFFEGHHLTEEEMDVGRAIFAAPGALCYLALKKGTDAFSPDVPAAGAALAIHDGLATLFADSTLGQFRRQGFHSELIAARLHEALAQGCDLATASTLPASNSQRNYERLGFEVVYTKVTLVL